jgi:hypothetical protein
MRRKEESPGREEQYLCLNFCPNTCLRLRSDYLRKFLQNKENSKWETEITKQRFQLLFIRWEIEFAVWSNQAFY